MGLCEFAGVAQFHFERDLNDAEQLYQHQVLETIGTLVNMRIEIVHAWFHNKPEAITTF